MLEPRRWDPTWGSPPTVAGLRDGAREIFSASPSQEELELRAPLVRPSAREPGISGAEQDDAEEVIELGQNGYTLVLVSGSLWLFATLCCAAFGQLGVLWLVAMSSPEYFFESGQWIVPKSDFWAVNAMKIFSLCLTLFRVTGEFKDATKMCRVVTHDLKTPLRLNQLIMGASAFMMQYVVAVLVLFMAIHLILACTTPIGTIGKLWVVYMVLEFDNHLCNFILYLCFQHNRFEWKATVLHNTPHSRRQEEWHICEGWLLCYWIPVGIGLFIVGLSVGFDICPLTRLHYGLVRNTDPVLMLSSNLGLLGGCCPPQVTWNERLAGEEHTPANMSVPCLSPSAEPPVVYYVVLPDGKTAPSSLQVMEGRGGDNNHALKYGKVTTSELQLRWWLSVHGFSHLNIYEALQGGGAGGLGLYSSNSPFVAQWEIEDFPWDSRVRVYATAVNPETGALSPTPVVSAVILRQLCPARCSQCTAHGGECWKCERGFALLHGRCQACAAGCEACDVAGPGRCDQGHCAPGLGWASGGAACLPCAGGSACRSCDMSLQFAEAATGTSQELPCKECSNGRGLAENGTCLTCETPGCLSCPTITRCKECLNGYALVAEKIGNSSEKITHCKICAAHCSRCTKLGPGNCDPEMCETGYSLSPTGQCAVCAVHCLNCTRAGPGNCDKGQCKPFYGLQGRARCSKCLVDHCQVCDSAPDVCDACSEGFGLTPEKSCEVCAASCKRCTEVGDCAECDPRFGLQGGECFACADQCAQCLVAGPGRCDPGNCTDGWVSTEMTNGISVCARNNSAPVFT